MTIDKANALEKFDNFLMIMDDQLDWLTNEAAKLKIALNFKVNDIGKLENLFDLMSEGKSADEISRLVILFARYLGEIVRRNFNGKWHLSLDDEKNVNFNTPVIIGHTPIQGLEFSPITIFRAYSKRKRKGLLLGALKADLDPKILDLSDLEEPTLIKQ